MKTRFDLCLRHQTSGALAFAGIDVEIHDPKDIAPQIIRDAVERAMLTLNVTLWSVHHVRRVPLLPSPEGA